MEVYIIGIILLLFWPTTYVAEKMDQGNTEELPQLDIDMAGACNFMGQWKADGESWHPNVRIFGHLKCFLCHCKNGKFNCGRKGCPELSCKKRVRPKGSCCDECDAKGSDEPQERSGKRDAKKGCTLGVKSYDHGAKWRPPSSPQSNTKCARCKCKNGEVQCKIRCPKKCKYDRNYSSCCRHCSAEDVESTDTPSGSHSGQQKSNGKLGKSSSRSRLPLV